jgi:hypothetical protein
LDGRLVHVGVRGSMDAVNHQTLIQSLPTIRIELFVVDGLFHVCRLLLKLILGIMSGINGLERNHSFH